MRGMSSIAGAAARRACSAGLARGGARRREAVKAVPKMSAIAVQRGCKHADSFQLAKVEGVRSAA